MIFMLLLQALPAQEIAPRRFDRIDNPGNQTLFEVDRPEHLLPDKPLLLVFYALPNGNSIEWTKGRRMQEGDDWHFDIQHIAAQTRFLAATMPDKQIVVVYLANYLKSWPAWKRQSAERPAEIRRLVDSIAHAFEGYTPEITLCSHSGGGSLVFGYIDAGPAIPDAIRRIAFIDSNYGFEDSLHTAKLVNWLNKDDHSLFVFAYNDSTVLFNGKPLVSPTGGTWYRSRWMQRTLGAHIPLITETDTSFITAKDLSNKIYIKLKTNPEGKIYHTEQVARNGFIEAVIGGTRYARNAGYAYWGPRAYTRFIE